MSSATPPPAERAPGPATSAGPETSTSPAAGGAAESEATLESFGYRQELRRGLSTVDLLVYGLVFMVPIAPWTIFGVVYNAAGGMVPLVYVIGFVAMIFTASSYAQMSAAFPIAGSVYSYVGRGIDLRLGFLAGWAILLDYLLIPTLLYVGAAEAMIAIFPGTPRAAWIVLFLVVNTVVNYLGISFTAKLNRLFLAGELVFLAVFVVLAVTAISRHTNGAHFTTTPLFNADRFTPGLAAGALSIAVLSFLGFDGISTLSEEATGGRKAVGRATLIGLGLVAFFFVLQTWLAAMIVPNVREFVGQEPMNNAFYDIVGIAGGNSWKVAFAAANALAIGIANALVAQAATSRLLFSMGRDRQLPAFLAHINPRTQVPERAILLVSAVTLVLGLLLAGQISFLSSLVNFGALFSFLLLHVAVVVHFVVRRRSRNVLLHVVAPVIGFLVIGYVLVNADVNAKVGGLAWLVIGVLVLVGLARRGRSTELNLEEA